MQQVEESKLLFPIFMAWLVAICATLGSLFFSEVMEYTPCVLCWYQRIAMYPLVIVLLVGAFKEMRTCFHFAMPITVIGWLIALYHNLLHYKIVPETATPCREGVSCSTIYINWLGFITIPLLSFFAFSIIAILLVILKRRLNELK